MLERGLIEVRRGKGTFVTQPKITQELTDLTGFVEDMQALGRTPTARVLDKRVVAADDLEAEPVFALLRTNMVRLWSKLNTSWKRPPPTLLPPRRSKYRLAARSS